MKKAYKIKTETVEEFLTVELGKSLRLEKKWYYFVEYGI